jgi:ABC-2 type transport system permease protein
MHNFGTVLRFEVIRTLKKPTFWISILSIPVFGAILFAIIYFTNTATQDAVKKTEQEKFSLVVADESGRLTPQSVATAGGSMTNNPDQAIAQVESGKLDAFFYYPKDLSKQSIQVYNKNEGIIDNDKYIDAAKGLIGSVVTSSIDPTTVAVINNSVKVEQKNYENGKEVNFIGRMAMPAIFLVIFYMVIVFLSNQMLTSTTEEKENRVTEMILTSIKSRSLIVGKIFALLILGIIQIATLVLPIIAAYIFAKDALNIPDVTGFINMIQFEFWPILIGSCLLIGSLLLFTGFAVAIGAAVPTAKEANSFFGFVILFLVAPFWITSLIMSNASAAVVQIFSYFPLTAPVTLMLRNIFGNLTPAEGLIGIAVVFVSSIIMMSIAIRIFRFGTLEYSNRISLGAIFKRKQKNISD